jgi:integrase
LTKAALLRYANLPKLPPRGTLLRPEWQQLADKVSDPRISTGLSRFIRIASYQGLAPDAVNDEAVQRIVDAVAQVNWGRDARPFRVQVTELWNRAVDVVPGWPRQNLTPIQTSPRPSHLPLKAFPPSFQNDVENYLRWASGADPLAEDSPKPLKAGTLRLRREQLRIAASVLAKQFDDPTHVTSLAVLVEPQNAKRVLTAMLNATVDKKPTAYMQGVGTTFLAVARRWVRASEPQLNALKRLRGKLGSTPTGLTEKNRNLVRQFDDPRLRDGLLALPKVLLDEVRTRRLSPSRRLQLVQTALAIELLLVVPMRLQNLAGLRIGEQLQWPSGRSGPLYVVLNEDETKNDQPLEYQVPTDAQAMLHDYLDRYRIHAQAGESPELFVQVDGKGVPAGTLRDRIQKAIRRRLNIKMTPHQFRHLAATMFLSAHPGAIGVVRDLLGHKNLKTTTNFYAGRRAREAGKVYDQFLAQQRSGTTPGQ